MMIAPGSGPKAAENPETLDIQRAIKKNMMTKAVSQSNLDTTTDLN